MLPKGFGIMRQCIHVICGTLCLGKENQKLLLNTFIKHHQSWKDLKYLEQEDMLNQMRKENLPVPQY